MNSGVYSNLQIKQAYQDGHIVIHPYNPSYVNGSSYDVTLGSWYFTIRAKGLGGLYNPFDQQQVNDYFEGPFYAQAHELWREQNNHQPLANIPDDHPIIVLGPGERILAHTHEFIGIKAPGTAKMHARSTWARNGLAVCLDAGWADPGYTNRWNMQIYNMNQHQSIVLPVGERIAQVIFHHTGEVEGEYSSLSGKYQTGTNMQTIINSWRPESMLPKAWKDERQKPKEI